MLPSYMKPFCLHGFQNENLISGSISLLAAPSLRWLSEESTNPSALVKGNHDLTKSDYLISHESDMDFSYHCTIAMVSNPVNYYLSRNCKSTQCTLTSHLHPPPAPPPPPSAHTRSGPTLDWVQEGKLPSPIYTHAHLFPFHVWQKYVPFKTFKYSENEMGDSSSHDLHVLFFIVYLRRHLIMKAYPWLKHLMYFFIISLS